MEFLSSYEIKKLVDTYIIKEIMGGYKIYSTQEILDSGAISRLRGYKVKPGKVSDSIFGGKFNYFDKSIEQLVECENPPLETAEGLPLRIMVRTQWVSTHDIRRGEIPFKNQILAANHEYMRKMLSEVLGTSQFEVGLPDNSIVIAAEDLTQISFENVLRLYMAKSSTSTSLYQHYIKGDRYFCGHFLPNNLIANGRLPYLMDTPSTKSDEHDISISPDILFHDGICTPQKYLKIKNNSFLAFGMVSQFLREKGLMAVDTKTEHGINKKGEIVVQDEIWTMDSSRFWLLSDYNEQLEKLAKEEIQELNPKSYSKEFARGFSKGEEGYNDEQRAMIAVRYIEGIQHLLGKRFEPDLRSNDEMVISGIEKILERLGV